MGADAWGRVWLMTVVAAVVLTLLVVARALPDEAAAVREVQGWAFPGMELSEALRYVHRTEVLVVVGAVIAVVLWLRGDRRGALVLAGLLIVLPLAQAGLKELIERPRPGPDEVDVRGGSASMSFPSGHAMSPTVFYGWLLVYLYGLDLGARGPFLRWVAGVAAVLAVLLTGMASVYLGLHWPSDVIGGCLWGLVLLLAARAVYLGRVRF